MVRLCSDSSLRAFSNTPCFVGRCSVRVFISLLKGDIKNDFPLAKSWLVGYCLIHVVSSDEHVTHRLDPFRLPDCLASRNHIPHDSNDTARCRASLSADFCAS